MENFESIKMHEEAFNAQTFFKVSKVSGGKYPSKAQKMCIQCIILFSRRGKWEYRIYLYLLYYS